MGSQTKILKDASKEDVDYILKQLRHYNVINVSDIDSTKGIPSLAYAVKAVSEEKIFGAIETNGDRLDARSDEILKNAATASDKFLKETLGRHGAEVKTTGIEVEQILPGNTSNKKGKVKSVEVKE